jgi:hypothetical protein
VLQNGEHVDVLVARAVPTVDGPTASFEEPWSRRVSIDLGSDVAVSIPSIDNLILTKRFANRPKDLEDVRLLRILKGETLP